MHHHQLTAGDTLQFVTATPGFPASAGWALLYRLIPRVAGASVIEIATAAYGDDHRAQVGPSVTGGWASGLYSWASWVERSGETYTIASGQIEILPDPRQAAPGFDGRSASQRALDDARAALRAWDPATRRYKIGEREREFNSVAEIRKLIGLLELEVRREASGCNLGQSSGRIYYRAK
jgi:hypothetical protein